MTIACIIVILIVLLICATFTAWSNGREAARLLVERDRARADLAAIRESIGDARADRIVRERWEAA